MTKFTDLGLAEELLRAVREKGYEVPTPVQADAIPIVLSGRDLLAGARGEHVVALPLEIDLEPACEAGLVLDDENGGWRGRGL